MIKFFLAIALAMACAMGGSHHGTVTHPTPQTLQDSINAGSGGDDGHIHG